MGNEKLFDDVKKGMTAKTVEIEINESVDNEILVVCRHKNFFKQISVEALEKLTAGEHTESDSIT